MWKAPVSVLCGCLAALPLIGCAGDMTTPRQAATAPVGSTAAYYTTLSPRVYAAPAAPAAILVFLPSIGTTGGGEILAGDPALWTAQGFDVVMPPPTDIYRLAADEQAAMARLVASAHALADAPVWLVGPGPLIDAVLASEPQFGRGPISGVVMTSVTSNSGSCSESFFYSDPGTGAAPKVEVRKSGNCEAIPPSSAGHQPSALPAPQPAPPRALRIIEASAAPKSLPPAMRVQRLAQLIKESPSS
jgi:hypothetical protein